MLSCFLTQPLQVASGEREKASPWYLGHFITDECGLDQLSNAPVLRAGSPVLLLTPPPPGPHPCHQGQFHCAVGQIRCKAHSPRMLHDACSW